MGCPHFSPVAERMETKECGKYTKVSCKHEAGCEWAVGGSDRTEERLERVKKMQGWFWEIFWPQNGAARAEESPTDGDLGKWVTQYQPIYDDDGRAGGMKMAERTILTMKGIVKQYQVGEEISTVLKGIDLEVKEGEFLAVLGPSGSGKSTLMNIIGCLDVPTAGEYILDGRRIGSQDETTLAKIRNREIGFIFQSFFLMQRQTALQNVKLPLIYADVPEREQNERAEEMLRRVGLYEKRNYYPNQLSGGQQQRVAIARAMCNNPTILLADEPTGALDQKTGRQVMELFHEINEEGRTIIMITHDAHIASHAKRIVRILDGNIGEGDTADA